jgi:hypothetical protein
MRVYGVALALATSTFVWWPEVGRWPPYHPAYERMFVAIFFAWGLAASLQPHGTTRCAG